MTIMRICGLNKTTLLDYPGRVAATIFLGSCNFRCPFCQNGGLVLEPEKQPSISEEEILAFLKKRKGILDGVCITGGEPTLSSGLPAFLRKIKALGYSVKLDTNGSHPEILKQLVLDGLGDKAAMDIKSSRENYGKVCGLPDFDLTPILESVDFLMSGRVDYEFRTTVVRELHNEEDFRRIGEWIAGAKACYLQAYRDSDAVLKPGFTPCTEEEMKRYREILLETIPVVELRGVE